MKKFRIFDVTTVLSMFIMYAACSGSISGAVDGNDSSANTLENSVRIVYDANGAQKGQVPIDNNFYKQGDSFCVLYGGENLERDGYCFEWCWNSSPDGSGENYWPGYYYKINQKSGVITLYAVWREAYYSVSFYTDGKSSPIGTQHVKANECATEPEVPKSWYSYYIFSGWYTDYNYTVPFDFNTPITKDIKLYAKWEECYTYYDVSFYTFEQCETPKTQTVKNKDCATEPEVPVSLNGKFFAGWYTDFNCTIPFDFDTPITENIILYAKWIECFYVTYETFGNSETPEKQFVKANECIVEPEIPVSWNDKVFDGWYTDSDCTAPFDFYTPITEDITLYAKWKESYIFYSVYFDTVGWFITPETQTVRANEYVVEPRTPIPVYDWFDDLVFAGWYTDSDYTIPFDFNTPITEDITLYAKFVDAYHFVYFDTNQECSSPETQKVRINECATEPEIPVSSHDKFFDGWYTDSDCTTPFDFNTPITDHIFLFAKWVDCFYVSYFTSFRSDEPETQRVRRNECATEPEPPVSVVEYEVFGGWYMDSACTVPFDFNTPITKDIELNAKWDQYYSVSFNTFGKSSAPETQRVKDKECVIEPDIPVPANDDIIFIGWYKDSDFKIPFDFDTPITWFTELYAKWVNVYNVVEFYTKNECSTPQTQIVKYNEYAIEPEIPDSYANIFDGWFTDYGCTVPFDFTTPVTENIALYARWKDGGSIHVSEVVMDISVNRENGNSDSYALFATLGFDSYEWKINGEIQEEKSNQLIFQKSGRKNGTYIVVVKAKKGNVYESATIFVKVEAE